MDLNELRQQIDGIDKELARLFCQRMEVSAEIAKYKRENGLPVFDPVREAQKLDAISLSTDSDMTEYTCSFFKKLFELSKDYQSKLI